MEKSFKNIFKNLFKKTDRIRPEATEENSVAAWAERECRIACKRENPNYDFDSDKFDYGCACYKSALKAYKSLAEDGPSGMSINFTKNILTRLMNDMPLSPITDEDFFSVEYGTEEYPAENPDYLQERGLKDSRQCPRMSSLFREETLDGKVTYKDVDRAYHVNIEDESDTYQSWDGFLDDMFPITMPYMPKQGKYKIYEQTFLADRKNGDFDTKGIFYVITPEGEHVDINIFRTEDGNGGWKTITREEYDELLKKRLDPVRRKVAGRLINYIIDDVDRVEKGFYNFYYRQLPLHKRNEIMDTLTEKCRFFDNPDHWQYNTYAMRMALIEGSYRKYANIPELLDLANYLHSVRRFFHKAYRDHNALDV